MNPQLMTTIAHNRLNDLERAARCCTAAAKHLRELSLLERRGRWSRHRAPTETPAAGRHDADAHQ